MNTGVVFLLDVDNTLLDNDRIIADLHVHLAAEFGSAGANRYWTTLEKLRSERGYVDYLGALQRCRDEEEGGGDGGQHLLKISSFLMDYPFADRLYPHALELIAHLNLLGQAVILTDGDAVVQPRKLLRSGLWDAVQGRVLIYIHKEQMLDAVQKHYPARHYVMVDDKLRILTAMKATWGGRLTTIFPRQGHYALDAKELAKHPAADCSVERIGELVDKDWSSLLEQSSCQNVRSTKEYV